MNKLTEDFNLALVITVVLLTIVGLVNLYSALNVWGEAGNIRLFWLQIVWAVIGLTLAVFLTFSDYHLFDRLAYSIYIISLILAISTLFFGHKVAGHRSWLGIGGFGIQPSEFLKVAVIFVLAKYFINNPNPDGFNFIELIKPSIITIIPTGVVLMQHDLGSAIFLVLLFMSFAWFSKVKKGVIFTIVIAGITFSIFSYYYVLSDYQKARITTFINPNYDVKGSGYHLAQSRIAVGSGRLWGKGYLKGSINKLKYLPEKHTDFIFPVLAEEWGFAASLFVIALYFVLLAVTIETAKQARDRTGTFIAFGIGAYFFLQIVINLGGVLGLMPLTGITLPFLSYGGSATICTFISIGILLSIYRKRFVF